MIKADEWLENYYDYQKNGNIYIYIAKVPLNRGKRCFHNFVVNISLNVRTFNILLLLLSRGSLYNCM